MNADGASVLYEAFLSFFGSVLRRGLITGTMVTAAVLLARICLSHVPKRIVSWLWLSVIAALLLPVLPGFTIDIPVFPDGIPDMTLYDDSPTANTADLQSEALAEDQTGNAADLRLSEQKAQPDNGSGAVLRRAILRAAEQAAALIWLCGGVWIACFYLLQWLGTQRLCRGAVRKEKRGGVSVCQLDGIPTPFARGIIRKRIYLPDTVLPDCAEGILLHEQAHFRRGDIIWRGLYCVCLCMFWFQPLLWLGQRYFLYDAECACDELALHELQKQANGGNPADVAVMRSIRADYAQTLLRHAKKTKSGVLSFGATGIKGRVNDVLHPKNLRAGGIAGTLLAAFLVVAVMMVSSACADAYQNGGADKEHTAADRNLITVTQTPTSALYGYAEGYIEAHPDIWGACSVSFVLPDGWTIEERSAREGMIVDTDGTEKAEYRIVPFMPYNGEDEVPEGDWYKTVYAELRLSSMAVMRDYMPLNRNPENGRPVWENALAVWESEDEDFPDTGSAAETRAVPMVLGYHEDCGMFLQMIFCDDSVPTDVRKAIAESIVFRRDEEKDTTAS